jgi:hypothetical protein
MARCLVNNEPFTDALHNHCQEMATWDTNLEGGVVQLGLLVTVATNRPIVPTQVITMMENLVEWWLAGETEVLGENLPQCYFMHYKSHMFCLGANPGRRGGKPAANRLSYDTTQQ